MSRLIPRQPVPALEVPTVGGGLWSLAARTPRNFSMIVFYRGLHCPICAGYIRDLDRRQGEFAQRGVEAVVISSDVEERAHRAREEWGIEAVPVGYGLAIDKAREWGLSVSAGIGKTSVGVEEPALFNEPGLFLVRPDRTLYASSVNTMPFARPNFADVIKALDVILARNYPARGEA